MNINQYCDGLITISGLIEAKDGETLQDCMNRFEHECKDITDDWKLQYIHKYGVKIEQYCFDRSQ